jgi:hypothetical protein
LKYRIPSKLFLKGYGQKVNYNKGMIPIILKGKVQGTNVPFPMGTNVPAGTNVPFPTGTFVPLKTFFLSLTLKIKFEKLTYFLAVSSISCEFEPDR